MSLMLQSLPERAVQTRHMTGRSMIRALHQLVAVVSSATVSMDIQHGREHRSAQRLCSSTAVGQHAL